MSFFDSIECISLKEACKIGVIDKYDINEDGFIGTSGKNELFAMAFSDDSIDRIVSQIDMSFPLYMIRGEKLARAFLSINGGFEGEGYYEYVYDKSTIDLKLDNQDIHPLDLSYFDVVRAHYALADDEYIKERLSSGVVLGIFDDALTLMGFIGEHFEGAMGMLEIFPEYRRKGLGELLEKYKIKSLLCSGRVPFCNVFHDNLISPNLQKKLGLIKTENDTWWIAPKVKKE